MTAWHRGPMLAFDTETTGPEPNTARIVTATIVELGPAGIEKTHQWLINPGVEIPQAAIDVHGITNEHAREHGREPGVAVFELAGLLALNLHRGVPVVAFNAAFDFTVLDRECRRQQVDRLDDRLHEVGPVVDPHVLDKAVDPYRRGKRTLTAVTQQYGITLDGAHDATADALAAARVAFMLAERHPRELQVDLPRLHSLQVSWRAQQAASLQKYFRRTDPDAVVNGDWPVQALPSGWQPGYHPAPEPAQVSS